jgi:hypothetical protein
MDPWVAEVRQHCAAVIDRELARLARRAPSLTANQLREVQASLDDMAGSLLVNRLPAADPVVRRRLRELFVPVSELAGDNRADNTNTVGEKREVRTIADLDAAAFGQA